MPLLRRGLAALLIVLSAVLAASPASAGEEILAFHADIAVDAEGAIFVTERITVRAEGNRISRGIFRDFPIRYRARDGSRVKVPFDVIAVRRDGRAEPWFTRRVDDAVRVYIGREEVFLDPGVYVYEIDYRTDRQIGFFDEFDELYWNVTGNRWDFDILAASATLRLPAGADILQYTAYTGPEGAQGRAFETLNRSGEQITFRTTAPLGPGEGLTIAVGFQKGLIAPPDAMESAGHLLAAHAPTAVAAGGFLGVLGYLFFAWWRVGRDPQSGAVIPRFAPPADLSPAATRFVRRMGFDTKALSAALVSMAVKGYLTIEEERDGSFRLIKASGDLAPLSPGERHVARSLLGAQSTTLLEKANHRAVASAIRKLRETLDGEYSGRLFLTNSAWLIPPAIAVLLVGLVLVLLADNPAETAFMGLWNTVWLGALVPLLMKTVRSWSGPHSGLGSRIGAVAASAFLIPFVAGAAVGLVFFATLVSPLAVAFYAMMIVLLPVFYGFLKAPTRAGQAVRDEVEGFRLYLDVAERERLAQFHPPDLTPEVFERWLPYAIALDVEHGWSERFEREMAAAGQAPQQGYTPRWYRGHRMGSTRLSDLTSGIGASLASSAASASSPPGSSAGSGGGGFSGGGGGGGGGGGW